MSTLTNILKCAAQLTLACALSACGSGKPDDVSEAPRLDFECSIVNAVGCDSSNSGKTVFIGLDENLAINCGYQMSFYSGSSLIQAFDFSSQTTALETGGILTGLATHWVNSSQMPVILLPEKTFRLCGFIDFNSNLQLDINEPYIDSTFTVGSPFPPLSNWSNF